VQAHSTSRCTSVRRSRTRLDHRVVQVGVLLFAKLPDVDVYVRDRSCPHRRMPWGHPAFQLRSAIRARSLRGREGRTGGSQDGAVVRMPVRTDGKFVSDRGKQTLDPGHSASVSRSPWHTCCCASVSTKNPAPKRWTTGCTTTGRSTRNGGARRQNRPWAHTDEVCLALLLLGRWPGALRRGGGTGLAVAALSLACGPEPPAVETTQPSARACTQPCHPVRVAAGGASQDRNQADMCVCARARARARGGGLGVEGWSGGWDAH